MEAYSRERRPPAFYNPSLVASNWRPPYAYTPPPSQITQAPAIFSHPDYAHGFQHVQKPMDPPFAQEAMSQQTGIPLIQTQQTTNRYVREHVENMHYGSLYRNAAAGKGGDFVPAFSPIRSEGILVQLPALGPAGTVNPFMRAELENIHRGQQEAMRLRAPRQWQKGTAKGQGKGEDEAPAPPVPRYEGTDTSCSICQHEFQRSEMCLCLRCNHFFHEICWDSYERTYDAVSHECSQLPWARSLFQTFRCNKP